ncbi:MCP four helix bundle domain-containing protein [Salegentibacter sp.]|uniref:MCP four helix bundle domain-containing protein n=1 Tax=Salegentibacter sp. TaxID=1903072 RepID=UPI003567FA87
MKDLFSIKPEKRKRLILLLSLFFAFILIAELIENKNLQKIDSDFSSLYEDRLIPASQIYALSDLLHEKQLIFEHLNENNFRISPTDLKKIEEENLQINKILAEYETTLLVEEEVKHLANFKTNLEAFQEVEAEILYHLENKNFGVAQVLINSRGRKLFNSTNAHLNRLAEIQPEVGRELLADYRSSFGSSSLLYYFKIAITLLFGVFVLRLLGLVNLVSQPKQKFELN